MTGLVQMRLMVLACLVAAPVAVSLQPAVKAFAQQAGETATQEEAPAETPPIEGTAEFADLVLDRYAATAGWGAEFVRDGKGEPEALRLLMPEPPEADEKGGDPAALPVEPEGYRKRFKRVPFKTGAGEAVSFRSIEVGWATGGLPESRRDDLDAPHLEVHFRTLAAIPEPAEPECPADGQSCDRPAPDRAGSDRHLARPSDCFLPNNSTPVADAATPRTGLYNLASEAEADPSGPGRAPAVVYSTYDGEVVSLGVMLTSDMLQHAVSEAEFRERLSWPVAQPAAYRYAWWPRTVALEYRPDKRVFAISLEDFARREVIETCR